VQVGTDVRKTGAREPSARRNLIRPSATALILSIAVACGAGAACSYAAGLPPVGQLLPLPLLPQPAPSPTPSPGATPQPLPPCPSASRAHPAVPHRKLGRVRITHVADSFKANMFGIAAGGLIQGESCPALAKDIGNDVRVGARWLRIDINWAEIQNDGPLQYDWSPTDRVVQAANAQGLHVLGGIEYTPWWARPTGTTSMFGPDPVTYAAFAALAASHYARLGVHTFEIWNEPNRTVFWQPAPNPAAYAAILKTADLAIRAVDPTATVLTGGTAPAPTSGGNYSPIDFLKGIYAAGDKRFFDAVADHPYTWPILPGAKRPESAWYQMYGTHPSLRSVMIANGDGAKKIWVTEFGAPTDGPTGTFVSDSQQAKTLTRAYKLFAGYRWAGPLFFFQGRDLGADRATDQDFFGLTRADFSPKPAFTAYASVRNAVLRAARHRSHRPARHRSHRPARHGSHRPARL
jgi:hypothetical protein